MKRELMIALIKHADTDDVVCCSADAATLVGKNLTEIIGKSSAETWPDQKTRYRQDDEEVNRTGKPKLGIREFVRINGNEFRVVTEKYPIVDGLILVLVYRDAWTGDYENGYMVARVRCPPNWKPQNVEDFPRGWRNSDIESFELNPHPDVNIAYMSAELAMELAAKKNRETLKHFCGTWYVVLPPGF